MELIAYITIGIIIGGISAWLIASYRHSNQITEIEKRASGAEAIVIELRQQVQQRDY